MPRPEPSYDAVAPLLKFVAFAPPVIQVLFHDPSSGYEIGASASVPSLELWCAGGGTAGPPPVPLPEHEAAVVNAFRTVLHHFAWDPVSGRWACSAGDRRR